MKKKIIIHLSGAWPKNIFLSEGDQVYVASSIDRARTYKNALTIDEYPSDYEGSLCSQYTKLYSDFSHFDSSGIVLSFLNDFYSYSLRPFFSLALSVQKIIEDYSSDHEIIIMSGKTDCKIIPMFGFRTSESLRGSQDLLGSLVAQKLKAHPRLNNIKFISAKNDFLCKEVFRVSLLKFADYFFSLLFIIRFMVLGLGRDKPLSIESVIICRNRHQFRFAAEIIKDMPGASILLLPQLTQGRLFDLLKLRTVISNNGRVFGLSISEIFDAFLTSRKTMKEISSDSLRLIDKATREIRIKEFSLRIDISWIAEEVSRISIITLYKSILGALIKKYSIDKIINFELVGRMAGIEALSAREHSIPIATVQTALVSSRPHPVFPYSNIFFTDSEKTKTMLSEIGGLSMGAIGYAGPIYRVESLRKFSCVKNMVFYSQPYEIATTVAILNSLCGWALKNSVIIKLRLHPRDKEEEYKKLIDKWRGIISISRHEELSDLFNWADLSLTRTSSVAKESIGHGCPVLLCLWSEFDRNIKADYVNTSLLNGYCSFNEDDLFALLDSLDMVFSAGEELHREIFGEKSIADLAKELNDL